MSDPHVPTAALTAAQLETCWNACWARARRPVEGVLLPEDEAARIAERTLRNVALEYPKFPGEAEFTAKALEETSRAAREVVAAQRLASGDPEQHRDPADNRYDHNLSVPRLQRRNDEGHFVDREWNLLPPLLRPLALHTLSRKGIRGPDAEEVFNDTLIELTRERQDHSTPILDITVFEELIPLHTRITGFRAIDWVRKRQAQKNRPNTGDSYDALTDDPDHRLQFEDRASSPDQTTFERLYADCREALSDLEWELIFSLYVAQSKPVQELIADPDFCRRFGIRPKGSPSTKRRELLGMAETALEKIRNALEI